MSQHIIQSYHHPLCSLPSSGHQREVQIFLRRLDVRSATWRCRYERCSVTLGVIKNNSLSLRFPRNLENIEDGDEHEDDNSSEADNWQEEDISETPIAKLEAIASEFHTEHVPLCMAYINNPPKDRPIKQFKYKKLSKTILTQILMKLNGVEMEGD
jgi:hypothetical protein